MYKGLRFTTAFGLAALMTSGCDSTVGLDPTPLSLTDIVVPGACKVDDNLSQIDVSVILQGQDGNGILPGDKVQQESRSVGELIQANSFSWQNIEDGTTEGNAKGESSGVTDGVGLQTDSVQYAFNGSPANDQLIVLAIDNSGSLIGEDLKDPGPPDPDKASDIRDDRIAFFQTLLGLMPESTFFSVVSFKSQLPIFDEVAAVPTQNRDITSGALADLERGAESTTPLARTLKDILPTIINNNTDLDASVVLFTDGIETGDPTDDENRSEIDRVIADYQRANVSIFVLQLQPPVASGYDQGRDPKLVDLACRTGGEHFFIENPTEFTDSRANLANLVKNRLRGAWKVRTNTTLSNPSFAPDNYFISSQLTVALGTLALRSARLALSRDAQRDFDDTRLWFQK